MPDSIEYELTDWQPRTLWKCNGECKRFRHRAELPGALPAICCGQPARLVDSYDQPIPVVVDEELPLTGE